VRENLPALYQIQQTDLEIAHRKQSIATIDNGDSLAAEIGVEEAQLQAQRQQLHAAQTEYRDQELELKTLQDKKSRFESQLATGKVRNPREIEDLMKQVNMLQREADRVETRALELMLQVEDQRSHISGRESTLAETRDRLQSMREKFETTGGRLRDEIAQLEARRKELSAQVGPPLLKRYDSIRIRQGNLGLAKVVADTCPGCRVTISSERLKGIKSGRTLESCDNCGRLLMWGGEGD
jgi:hypothetical protein